MAKKQTVMPTHEEASNFVREKIVEILGELQAHEDDVGFRVNYTHEFTSNKIKCIAISHRNHSDLAYRPHFEIVETVKTKSWQDDTEKYLREIAERLVRISKRRKTFMPQGEKDPLPKKAWDVDPATAAILKLCNRFPVLDGTHRISGDYGKVVNDLKPKGFEHASVAYGDGIIKLVSARFTSGDEIYLQDERIKIKIHGTFPETMITGLRNKKAGDVIEAFRIDKRSHDTRITKVENKGSFIILTLADRLFPLDAKCKGDESWRMKRLAA